MKNKTKCKMYFTYTSLFYVNHFSKIFGMSGHTDTLFSWRAMWVRYQRDEIPQGHFSLISKIEMRYVGRYPKMRERKLFFVF